MKKLIAVSAVAALAATALSAEVTFGAWGRALWVTAANAYSTAEDKDVVVTDVHQSWGEDAPRVGVNASGNSDNVGFSVDYHANGAGGNFPGDNCLIWVKPIEQVKLTVGKIDQNELRGDACFGLWNWDRIGAAGMGNARGNDSEGWTFADYLDADGAGVSISVYPVEGLTLGAGLPTKLNNSDGKWDNGAGTEYGKGSGRPLEEVLGKKAAYVGAYKIEGVGTIKAALKMQADGTDKDGKAKEKWQTIAAAFDLTSVENLFVSVGATIPTLNSQATGVNAYARYGVNEALTAHLIVGTKIGQKDAKKSAEEGEFKTGLGFLAGVGIDYNLEGGLALFADVRYANNIFASGTSADKSDNLVLGAGVTKGFSNGLVGVAFEGSTNGRGRYLCNPTKDPAFMWEIPVRFEYWF
ncbi:hypothetical protein DYE50_09535 [Treponema ruminis]|uniref:Outer membrane protein OmpA-like transmembrane domain-containing protein n=1 Tax=Treponema ruminis TaxID=744515 RepID=A0A7W8G9D7_9SPIR|nr:hypothetical protein [Treponema ruminis]MBB5226288.1 hypothetical protein [Treponema ruminis]QSI02807.1 hypothetical protein DYE50_09535 [Treponema ruminis]